MNKQELSDAVQAIATDITIASKNPRTISKDEAEKRMIENAVLIGIGIFGAFLDIRDSLAIIAQSGFPARPLTPH